MTNGSLGNFVKIDDNNFTVDFTADGDGICTAIINANTLVDSIGNVNVASGPFAGPYKWIRDTVKPIIKLIGNQTIIHEFDKVTPYVDPGVNVIDTENLNGHVHTMVTSPTGVASLISKIGNDELGTYTIQYDVQDSLGNVANSVIRSIIVKDTTPPVITLNAPHIINIEIGDTWPNEKNADPGVTIVSDNFSTNANVIVVTNTNLNTNKLGSYQVSYIARDQNGNDSVPLIRTINVVDTVAPRINIIGSIILVHERGTPYYDLGATAVDNIDGNLFVNVTNNVNSDVVEITLLHIVQQIKVAIIRQLVEMLRLMILYLLL